MKILNVVGARPNFIKIAPLMEEMGKEKSLKPILVHTGQHYDYEMSQVFFEDLKIPKPDMYLGVGSGSHATQTARIMTRFERVCLEVRPDLVLVVGDVNSTLACSLVAAKLLIPLAHVEAGLRSYDRTMPEEINRRVCDSLSSYLFVTSRNAIVNLKLEGIPRTRIHFVGNVMIDTLLKWKQRAAQRRIPEELGLRSRQYAILTLHRPSNVDSQEACREIFRAIEQLQKQIPIVFPLHLRTRKMLKEWGFLAGIQSWKNLKILKPLGYLSFLNLLSQAKLVLTDSGGIQEETTVLGIPCLTLRKNTERPETVLVGTNTLVDPKAKQIVARGEEILKGKIKRGRIPELWDGKAARRVVAIIMRLNSGVERVG